jgi:hypothetical protein
MIDVERERYIHAPYHIFLHYLHLIKYFLFESNPEIFRNRTGDWFLTDKKIPVTLPDYRQSLVHESIRILIHWSSVKAFFMKINAS